MLKNYFFWTLLIFFSILLIPGISALETLILSDEHNSSIPLSGKMEILPVEKNNTTLDELLLSEQEQAFQLFNSFYKLTGNSDGYWFRFTIINSSKTHNHYILEYNYYRAWTKIEVYIPSVSGEFIKKKEAPGLDNSTRDIKYRNPVFAFNINYKETKTIYIKLQTETPVYAHFNIMNFKYFHTLSRDEQMHIGYNYGILFVMAFYNLFLFFAFKDKSFLFLMGLIINLLILQLSTNGILGENIIILQNYDYLLGRIFMLSTTIFFVLFGRSFIQSKKQLPSWDKILLVLLSIHTGIGILNFFYSELFLIRIITLLLPILWFIILAIRLYFEKNERAKYFLLISGSIILFGVFTVIQAYIPFLQKIYLHFTDPINTGTIVFILLFSFFLTSSISKLQKKEIQAQKILELDEVKSRFFTNISHEFRTPLTLITGPLEDMLSESTNKVHQNKLEMMLSNSRRLLNLVNQLLDLSMIDNDKMKLQACAEDVIHFLKNITENFSYITSQNQQQIHFKTSQENVELYYDSEKLGKIMLNLIINSIKFTPAGGHIFINCELVPGDLKQKSIAFQDGYIEITVADTGIGISPEHQDRIFDRFYHVNENRAWAHAGTGIGLALVKELVELHHASIILESNSESSNEQRTRFILRFPLGRKHLDDKEISTISKSNFLSIIHNGDIEIEKEYTECFEKEKIPTETTEKKLILLVEDNEDVRQYIREGMEGQYTIIESKNGAEGFKAAKQFIPDLIVCDLLMPVMDGFEFCRLIKQEFATNHIPIILLTARADVDNMIKGFYSGVDDYITKPFNMSLLHARIKNLIDLRCLLQQKIQRKLALQPTEITGASEDEEFIKKLQSVIEENISDFKFNIDILAESLFLSRASLNRKIRALTGESSNQFIQSYRLQQAANMIKSKTHNITEIAYAVGFSSTAYFSKCFKEKFHQTPSQYE
ncbi:MAG: response regulator [Spirochaetales bacterium]|nr:response regulator [Spirochaetales bacterium]